MTCDFRAENEEKIILRATALKVTLTFYYPTHRKGRDGWGTRAVDVWNYRFPELVVAETVGGIFDGESLLKMR